MLDMTPLGWLGCKTSAQTKPYLPKLFGKSCLSTLIKEQSDLLVIEWAFFEQTAEKQSDLLVIEWAFFEQTAKGAIWSVSHWAF